MNRPNSVKLLVVLESIVAAFLAGGGSIILEVEGVSNITLLLGGVHVM